MMTNEMMTNEELAEFEKENEFQVYKTMYVSYPEYKMIYMLKSPKTCAVNGIEEVTNKNLHLDIPASVEIEGNTYWVNEIFEEGFWDNGSIETVTIPDTVTRIDRGAFQGCHNLKSVYIPDSVTLIEEIAFACCDSLESVSLPGGDIELEDECFDDCPLLTITRR